ncbi:short-chain dehydrogenase [Virgibacillus sp. FSP13]
MVGGTGMLRDVSKWIIQQCNHTSVIARNREKLNLLQTVCSASNVDPVSLDYKNTGALKRHIQNQIASYGAIDTVVAWLHGDAPQAIPALLDEISSRQKVAYKFFHIKGSSYHLKSIQSQISTPKNCHYRDIQLGFVVEGDTSRWLIHKEIAEGVITAIKQDRKRMVVGQLEPWERRP